MELPELAETAKDLFPSDVIARAKILQEEIGSIGAYSHSQGVPYIRQSVAKFIEGLSFTLYLAAEVQLMNVSQNGTVIRPTLITYSLRGVPLPVCTISSRCSSRPPSLGF